MSASIRLFLSTPSARRATAERAISTAAIGRFLSTPSARRATDGRLASVNAQNISIHALREEGDRKNRALRVRKGISIHALREEGDSKTTPRHRRHWQFLSTPSARRATNTAAVSVTPYNDFYPRPPRGGRQPEGLCPKGAVIISIHALREEGDLKCASWFHSLSLFLSTPSARRATADGHTITQSRVFLSTPSARRATREHDRDS